MTDRPWLLVACAGITAGAIGGATGVVVAALFAAVVALAARQAWVVLTIVVLFAGAAGTLRVESSRPAAIDSVVTDSTRAEVVVASTPQSGPSGPRAVVSVERIESAGESAWEDASGRVLVFFGDTLDGGLGNGDRLLVRWSVTESSAEDPGFRTFIQSSGASATAWIWQVQVLERSEQQTNLVFRWRDRITERLEQEIDGDAGALLAGFVTGDDSGLSDSVREAFDRTNTSHITAVSGSNVGVLVAFWVLAVRSPRLQRAWWAQVLLVGVIWLYVLLVGLNPGAVRAGIFATVLLPAARFGRRADPLTALMVASAGMLLVSPGYASNLGFWLSLAASGAMIMALPADRNSDRPLWYSAIVALLAAQIATFPITFWAFGGWSPASLVANLLIGPLVTAFVPVAFIISAVLLVFPWLSAVIGWLPKLGADAIIAVVESLSTAFPMVRSSAMSEESLLLVTTVCLLALAPLWIDVRRWVVRVVDSWDVAPAWLVAMLLGSGLGVWGVALYATIVR